MRRAAMWLALAWTLGMAAYFLLVPVYGSSTSGLAVAPGAAPARWSRSGRETLLSVGGSGALIAILLPVLLAALPLAARSPRGRRTLSAVGAALLGVFTVLGAASVGLFYAPAAAALALAAAWPGGASSRPAI